MNKFIICSLVEIGLPDLPKSGDALGPSAPTALMTMLFAAHTTGCPIIGGNNWVYIGK